MNVPHQLQHPASPSQDWDTFEVTTGTANVAVRLEENGAPGRSARRALIKADAGNAADVSIGPDQNADMDTIGAGMTYSIPDAGDGRAFTLGNWWVKSASATQKVRITYV